MVRGGTDALVIKTNSAGDTIWSKTYGGAGDDYFNCVKQTPAGDYILVGSTSSFGLGGSDVYVVKINSTGDTLWSKTFGSIYDDEGTYISLSLDSGFIIVGSTKSSGSGGYDIYLIKGDKFGNGGCNSFSGGTQIKNADSLMFNVSTTIGLPRTLVDVAPFSVYAGFISVSDVCSSIGIQTLNEEGDLKIKIYPSPSTGSIFIYGEETPLGLIRVYDLQGKILIQQSSSNANIKLDISHLQSGTYIIEVFKKHLKIVKE